MHARVRLPAVFALLFALLPVAFGATTPWIDEGRYANDAAAQAVWKPMRGSAPAAVATIDGRPALRLPCNFAGTTIERASWDRTVTLDLSASRGVQFEFYCSDTAPVSQFSMYFQSGAGWYSATFQPERSGAWCTVTIPRASARTEGTPDGWHRINTIRVSGWRGKDVNTDMYLRHLRPLGVLGVDAEVAVIRGDSLLRANAGEARSIEQFTSAVATGLESSGIVCATPGDLDVSDVSLRDARLVVLPYNPSLPPNASRALLDYVRRGGRLLAFYGLPADLAAAVGIENGRLLKDDERAGRFASIRVASGGLPGAPAETRQRSWNIREARPASRDARVVAEWYDQQGKPTGQAAVIATPSCVLMTHVLLSDDLPNQRRLLLALAGHLLPDLWRQGAASAIARIGEIGGSRDFDSAAALIARQSAGQPRAQAALAEARSLHAAAVQLAAAGKHAEAVDRAPRAAQRLLEAFCLAQKPEPGEFRAFWCHSAFGVEGMDWDAAIKRLADAGFTAILPNMLWGGVAYYPSKTLPVSPEVATRGDQIAQCLAAAKKYGLQVHVWKVNWNAGHRAPAAFIERMRREGRLQKSSKGKEEPWLCPSHPENQALEIASMVEVARDYDVAGIHFDYIRYPGNDHCFCEGCRARFAKVVGAEIAAWPQDALAGGRWRSQWLDWRRSNITTVVRAVSEQARTAKPGIKISAAVFRNWSTDSDGVAQDWKLWCERGWLDFVCPMNYTTSDPQLDNWIAMQKEWAGRVPVYPGIGVSTGRLTADRTIAQIDITRRHQTHGFIIFNYSVPEARDLVPLLGLGATAKPSGSN